MPPLCPLSIYRGDTTSWQFVLWQDAAKTLPYDLTGIEVKAEIRDRPSGATIVPLTLTVTLPNVIDALLSAVNSSLLPVPAAVWDLQLTDATGAVTTVLAGYVSVAADVTDSSPPAPALQRRVRLVA